MLLTFAVVAWLAARSQEPTPASAEPGEASQPTPADARTQDGHRIKEPRKTKHVAPKWPENAVRAGLNGAVILECVVGIDGRVKEVKTVRGFESLAKAASEAVRKWRYTPTELNGMAVPVIMTVTVNFKLQEAPKRDDVMASLRDHDPDIRWAAVVWLGRYRPVTAEQKAAIEAALQDPSERVRNGAREALGKLETK